jgi:RNA recognition motif-containing protein
LVHFGFCLFCVASCCLTSGHSFAGVDEKVLYYLFTAFGEITSVRIVRDGAGIHKVRYPDICSPRLIQSNPTLCQQGYGFVLFSSASAAQHATNEMHHRKVGPRKIVCAVSNQGSKLNNQAKPKAEEGPWRGTNTGVAAVLREKAVQPAWSENTTPVQKLIVVVDSSEDENEQSKVLASLLPTSSKVTELKPKSKYAEVTAKTVIGPKSEELGMAKFAPVRQFVPRSTAGMLLVPGYKVGLIF